MTPVKSLLLATIVSAFATLPVQSGQPRSPLTSAVPDGAGRVQLVQSGDASYRVNELENEVRRLNGRVEELNFLLLELQEQLRKQQTDNELRFQELEDKHSDASDALPEKEDVASTGDNRLGKPEPSGADDPDVNTLSTDPVSGATDPASGAADLASGPVASNTNETATPTPGRGDAPKSLGTLTFDAQGNVINAGRPQGESEGQMASLPGVFSDGVDAAVAAARFGPTPNAVFSVGKTALENRRFKRAEQAFSAFLQAWPNDPREGEARYFLGNALFQQNEYYKAANVYLDTHNAHPQAQTAPDNLLGLGLALAGLNQREVACATYSEVLKQYPNARARLQSRVEAEQSSARC